MLPQIVNRTAAEVGVKEGRMGRILFSESRAP